MTKKLTKKEIEQIIKLHNSMKKSYFFTPPTSANARRGYEKKHSMSVKGSFNDHELNVECETKCSCKNVYYRGSFYIDGKKCTIRKVKNLIK